MDVGKEEIIHQVFTEPIPGIVHGAVSRHGGESVEPFAGNNISFGVGDDAFCVTRNRNSIKKRFGLDCLVSAHQVHGKNIYRIEEPIKNDCIVDDTDALITNVVGVGLMIGHADCQAVLLYDPNNRAVAAIHNGWRGSVVNIVAATIEAMQDTYGTTPESLIAGIGPSLGPCCAEFIHYERELPKSFQDFRLGKNHFDFWKITREQLQQCGVPKDMISCSKTCTVCSSDFFSYRRACRENSGVTGRNGSLIALV